MDSTTDDASQAISRLRSTQAQITRRMKARDAAQCADRDRLLDVESKIHSETIRGLLGIADAVRIGHRRPSGHRDARFNDALGTVVDVKRTRALVDYGALGKWSLPLTDLKPASAEQGMFVSFSGGTK